MYLEPFKLTKLPRYFKNMSQMKLFIFSAWQLFINLVSIPQQSVLLL